MDLYSASVESPPVQRNQPSDISPLEFTGERILPDLPEENYIFQRHLAVYQWVATQVSGRRVIDMACGEGYGSALLAGHARSVVGVDSDGTTYHHARRKYRRANLRFELNRVEDFNERGEVVVFLQTIEHLEDPSAVLGHFVSLLEPGGAIYLSTPNLLTQPVRPGATKSDNPWHVREYAPAELQRLCMAHALSVELLGVYHARKLRVHDLATRLGWSRLHPRLRVTKPFYEWLYPAITAADFAVRPRSLGRLRHAHDLVAVLRP